MTELAGPGDDQATRGAEIVRSATSVVPTAAIMTGSGLGGMADAMEIAAAIDYADLPGFPEPTVPGHIGRLLVGTLAGVPVAVFLGRIHHYEGHPMELVTLPIRLAASLGARIAVLTAAVGGLEPGLEPGSLVVGTDHLNFLGANPLRGWRDEAGRPAFVSLTGLYPEGLAARAVEAAGAADIPASRGVYAAMPGPTYETPAEVAFLRSAGASVVGMSVVPEACAAAALGMRCLGLYCVTNKVGAPVSHAEVERVAAAAAAGLGRVLEQVLPTIGDGDE